MLIAVIISLLISNAVSSRQDKSILYSRITIIFLLLCSYLTLDSLYLTKLGIGIGLYGGLFVVTSITHTFHIFLFLVSAAIIQLTNIYPRKLFFKYSSRIFLHNTINFKSKILNKMGEQFKIIEYPLIILFIITGAIFLVSTSVLASIFLSLEKRYENLFVAASITITHICQFLMFYLFFYCLFS